MTPRSVMNKLHTHVSSSVMSPFNEIVIINDIAITIFNDFTIVNDIAEFLWYST